MFRGNYWHCVSNLTPQLPEQCFIKNILLLSREYEWPTLQNLLAGDKTIFSKNNENMLEKKEWAWISGTKEYAKFKTIPPPVEQGVQGLTDDSFRRKMVPQNRELPLAFITTLDNP